MTREELKQELKTAATTAMLVISSLNVQKAAAMEQINTRQDEHVERTEYIIPNKDSRDQRAAIREIEITNPNSDEKSRVRLSQIDEKYREYNINRQESASTEMQREEYDKRDRLRLKEELKLQSDYRKAGPLERTFDYTNDFSNGTFNYNRDEYDKKGNTTKNREHSGFYGSSVVMKDIVIEGRKGKDIYQEDLSGIENVFEVYHSKQEGEENTDISYTKYNKKGGQDIQYTGSYNSEIESYTKEKDGKYTELSYINGKYKGYVSEEDNGEVKTKELSERKVKRQVRKIRNLLERKLKKETGAEDMKEYGEMAPDRNEVQQAPLDLAFRGDVSQEKYSKSREQISQENIDITSEIEKGEKVIISKRESEETKPRQGKFTNETMREIVKKKLSR